ncbi:MAG TPA: T9SS type A sorting domain-containing protein [Saprospiraceae bacterium]|nr:T9SS type A sorting domain-containing protein [Saprospiraceae bacterium]HMP14772.1 T9SS type A sorting domain-containing protein [Saprospiraceae bacterium]
MTPIQKKKLQAAMVITICCFLVMPVCAQFQFLYGTASNESFGKVIPHGSEYYVLGQGDVTAGQTLRATIARVSATGALMWVRHLNISSQWNDAVLTSNGNLLVVGHTLPFDETARSLMAVIQPNGTFSWVRSYNVSGRETFNRVVHNPLPENANFPYYVLGTQWDPAGNALWDDVILLTVDATTGNIGWKKRYAIPSNSTDDEFARDLEALPNGDLLLSGNLGANGVIFRANNTGIIFNASGPQNLSFSFADVTQSGNNFFAIGNTFPTFSARLMKLNASLIPQWQVSLPALSAVRNVWTSGNAIYVSGSATIGGLNRGVVLKFQDGTTGPTLSWLKYLHLNETAYTGGAVWPVFPSAMAFADGRTRPLGLGGVSAFLSVSDLEMNTCMTVSSTTTVTAVNHTFFSLVPPETLNVSTPVSTNESNALLMWQRENACPPCEADFSFSISCGTVTFTDLSDVPTPVSWQWTFPGGTPASSSVQNPVVNYSTCSSYTACLTVSGGGGCSKQVCKTIVVVDNTPPIAICKTGVTLTLGPTCIATLTPTMLDGGSTDNCLIASTTVSPSTFNQCGVFPATLTVTDWCGNRSNCTTMVTVTENIAPNITCPQNINLITLYPHCDTALFNIQPLMATDNCGIPIVSYTINGATNGSGLSDASGTVFAPGTSTVTYTATDLCNNTASCSFDVVIECDTCACGGFADMYVRAPQGAMNQLVSCNGSPVALLCFPGQGYHLSGAFHCAGNNCSPQHQISWTLTGGGISESNSFVDNDPYFSIHLLPIWFPKPDIYTLTITGNCGNQICTCVIQFVVDCTDLCPCDLSDILDLQQNVDKGFAVAIAKKSCHACFSPLALSDCDRVEWYVNSINSPSIGSTVGNATICYKFNVPGTYTIIMVVTRRKPDGSICEVFVKSQTITLTCVIAVDCTDPQLPNARFRENPIPGGLNAGGSSPNWAGPWGNPQLWEVADSRDGWAMLLTGCFFNADVLSTAQSFCIDSRNEGLLSTTIRTPGDPIAGATIKVGKKPPGGTLSVVLYTDATLPWPECPEATCYTLARLENLLPIEDDDWYELQIPYNLSDWDARDSCGDSASGIPVRLALYVSNFLSEDQGDEPVRDGVLIDDICFQRDLVATKAIPQLQRVRLYPNPTSDSFTLELSQPASVSTHFRVMNLTGQIVWEKRADIGQAIHLIDLCAFPAGLYFVQIVEAEGITGIGKIIKQ